MVNEIIDTTNNLIKLSDISLSDNDVIRQLSDNLQDITSEDIDAICDEMDKSESGIFELLSEVDGSNLEFERNKKIVKRKGRTFDLNTKSGEKSFMNEVFSIMKSSDITKMIPILMNIFDDNTISKLHEYLIGGFDYD